MPLFAGRVSVVWLLFLTEIITDSSQLPHTSVSQTFLPSGKHVPINLSAKKLQHICDGTCVLFRIAASFCWLMGVRCVCCHWHIGLHCWHQEKGGLKAGNSYLVWCTLSLAVLLQTKCKKQIIDNQFSTFLAQSLSAIELVQLCHKAHLQQHVSRQHWQVGLHHPIGSESSLTAVMDGKCCTMWWEGPWVRRRIVQAQEGNEVD